MTKEEIIQQHERDYAAYNRETERMKEALDATEDLRQQVALMRNLFTLTMQEAQRMAAVVAELQAAA